MKKYFTTGLLVLLPLVASIWVIYFLVMWLYEKVLRRIFEIGWVASVLDQYPLNIQPWIGGIISLGLVILAVAGLGVLATNVAGKWFIGLIERLMKKVPLASTIYSFVKGLIDSFSFTQKGYFEKVVLVEYPYKGIYSVGFLSRRLSKTTLEDSCQGEKAAVYIPQAPNPTTGMLVIVDTSEVKELDMTFEEGLKFIVSGGVLLPAKNNLNEKGGKSV